VQHLHLCRSEPVSDPRSVKDYRFCDTSSSRVAFKCALSGQWVILTAGGESRLIRHAEHQWLVRVQDFSRAVGDPDELAEIVRQESAPGKERSWSISTICLRFDADGLLYDLYRDLSQAIHPSYGMIQAYFNPFSGSEPAIHRTGKLWSLEYFSMGLGLAAVWAMQALGALTDSDSLGNFVAEIAQRAELPHDLRHSDRSPEEQEPSG